MREQKQPTIYRDSPQILDATYDPKSDQTLVEALTQVLAEAKGVDAVDLPPIYDSVDTESLTAIINHPDGATKADAIVGFEYGDLDIFLRSDGCISVCDGTQSTEPTTVFAD